MVKKGEVLFELDVSKSTDGGNVSDTNVAMVKAKIVNAEDIIAKLKVNKDGFIETTHRQILRYEHSLNETEKMLTTAQKGLTHIEKSLQNYSDYLKRGLINKDQYNNQHSLLCNSKMRFSHYHRKKCSWNYSSRRRGVI